MNINLELCEFFRTTVFQNQPTICSQKDISMILENTLGKLAPIYLPNDSKKIQQLPGILLYYLVI